MRKVRYNVAASLDGYIAGPDGSFDWIPNDPAVDFAALFANVDAVLLGRRSYELVQGGGGGPWPTGAKIYVFSRTLRAAEHPGVTIVDHDAGRAVAALRAAEGGDIWLFGGGALFASLMAEHQVDRVEVTVVPVLLGGGVPLYPGNGARMPLMLEETKRYPSGMFTLAYGVPTADAGSLDAERAERHARGRK
jgi:dihydrofolate reductase